MRALLIDPAALSITEVDYNGDWRTIGPMIGADLFDVVYLPDDQILYVDDEGLMKNPKAFMFFGTLDLQLAGKGLLLAEDGAGDTIATNKTEDWLSDLGYAHTALVDFKWLG